MTTTGRSGGCDFSGCPERPEPGRELLSRTADAQLARRDRGRSVDGASLRGCPRYNFARGTEMKKTRYAVLAALGLITAMAQPPARPRQVAITIDDGPAV